MIKTEIVYRNENGKMRNFEFESFEQASSLIDALDRRNVPYDWYELVNGQWVDVSHVEVLQDEESKGLLRYIKGNAA